MAAWVLAVGMIVLLSLSAGETAVPATAPADRPLFSFGILADVQYAAKEAAERRRYRDALPGLRAAVDDWNGRDLAFVIQLGDIIDGNVNDTATREDLRTVLAEFGRLKHRLYHVLGNHCLTLPRAFVADALGLKRAYYDFERGGWRFIVLDGMDVGVMGWPPDSPHHRAGEAYLREQPTAKPYNGAIGEEQLDWLEATLADADRHDQRAVLFCHLPAHPASAARSLCLWNHRKVREILQRHPCIAAFINGHEHAGGYAVADGVHYLTLHGLVEAPPGEPCHGVIDVYPGRLVLRGTGSLPSRTMEVPPRPSTALARPVE